MIRYFSMDAEFSGLDHRKNCLLSIGIIEVVKKNNKYIPLLDRKLYLELKPEGSIDPEAMKVNKLNIDNLKEFGINKKNACREIIKFLNLSKNDNACLITYCGVLDKIFLDQLFQDCNYDTSPFNYELLEISSLAIGKLNLEWGFSEKDLLSLLNIKELNNNEKHNALQDAILQANEFCGIMNK